MLCLSGLDCYWSTGTTAWCCPNRKVIHHNLKLWKANSYFLTYVVRLGNKRPLCIVNNTRECSQYTFFVAYSSNIVLHPPKLRRVMSKMAQAVSLLTLILKMSSSNFARYTHYPEVNSDIFQSHPKQMSRQHLKLYHNRIIPNSSQFTTNTSYCWRIKDQLDVTSYFISLLMCSTCFGH